MADQGTPPDALDALKGAAARLNISQSSLSRRVADLDVAARSAAYRLRVGGELDLLVLQGSAEDAQRRHECRSLAPRKNGTNRSPRAR